jgi:hypothetical protein
MNAERHATSRATLGVHETLFILRRLVIGGPLTVRGDRCSPSGYVSYPYLDG